MKGNNYRAGCSITLALLGMRKEDISRHVGWANTRIVDFYNDLSETLKFSSPKASLDTCVSKGMTEIPLTKSLW